MRYFRTSKSPSFASNFNQKPGYTNFKCIVVTRESIKIGFGLINEQLDCLRTLKLCSTQLNEVILNILLLEFSS